ncbi:MAG: hypothetical protein AAGI07_12340, partial [Bacteroidota bacterium]
FKSQNEAAKQLAQCYIELKNFAKAGEVYKDVYQEKSLLAVAEDLFCKGYYQEGARLFSYLHSNISDNAIQDKYARLVARAYFKAGIEERSQEWYRKCLNEDELVSNEATITFNQQCETCEQLLKDDSVYLKMLDETGELDIDQFYFAQVRLNLSGKLLEASELINNTKIIYNACKNFTDPCILFNKTYFISQLKTYGINEQLTSEYSPVYFNNDSLIFASDRNPLGNKNASVNGEDRRTFDLYIQRMNEQDAMGYRPEEQYLHSDSLATTAKFFTFNRGVYYNEGPMAFFPGNNNKFIFTGNYYFNNDALKNSQAFRGDRINTLKLFIANKNPEDSAWQVKPLLFDGENATLFNSELYNVAHPTFNADGTQLYFSSDVPVPGSSEVPGAYGNSDIFVSTFDPNSGMLGTPVNLGAQVNSEGNEIFPFLHTNPEGTETLYFSSNFHNEEGVGQLDIYYSAYCNEKFTSRKNMGTQINSEKDDFGLILNEYGNAGYFSSNRTGNDDIYKFRELKILLTVLDKETLEPVLDVALDFIPEGGETLKDRIAAGGTSIFRKFTLDVAHTVKAIPDNSAYFGNETSFTTNLSAFDAYGILRDTILLEKKPEAKMIVLANVKSEQQIFIAFSKNISSFNSSDSITGVTDYSIIYEMGFDSEKGGNYLQNTLTGDIITLSPQNQQIIRISNLEEQQKQQVLKSFLIENSILVPDSVMLQDNKLTNPIVIRNIRYGFDSSNTTDNDAEQIDPKLQVRRLSDVLKEYQHLNAKVSSHTDECPLPPYAYDNEDLSKRRNEAAIKLIRDNYPTLDLERIINCNYAGQYPVDQSEENYSKNRRGQSCANQYNRRTEFKLLYTTREKYTNDCDCNDVSMIWHVGNEKASSNKHNFSDTTQGGR